MLFRHLVLRSYFEERFPNSAFLLMWVSVVMWRFQCKGPFGVVCRRTLLCVARYSAVEIVPQPGLLADSRKILSFTLTILSIHSFLGEASFPVPCTVLRPVVIMSLARLHSVCPTLDTCSKSYCPQMSQPGPSQLYYLLQKEEVKK